MNRDGGNFSIAWRNIDDQWRAGIFHKKFFIFHKANVQTKSDTSLSAWAKQMIQDEEGNLLILSGGNDLLTWNESKNTFSSDNNFFIAPLFKESIEELLKAGAKE